MPPRSPLAMLDLSEGLPEPLGVTADSTGANIAIVAPDAAAIEFCLFDPTGTHEVSRHRLPARTGALFHGHLAGLAPGARYGLRAHGPWAPEDGHRFNPAKLLVDPWAWALDRGFAPHPALFDTGDAPDPTDSAPFLPKAILDLPLPPLSHAPLRGPQVIYELHVRGFTMLHPDIPAALRGTFAGLGHPAAIAHLRGLGVTLVELLPVAAWIDERHLSPLGLTNYWGYNPVALLAPDRRLAPGGMAEIRAAVARLHEAGIGVLLDVVFNHTGEGDEHGPTLSLRGLGNAAYYRLLPQDRRRHVNDSGCGNTLALDRPWPVRLVMDALRHWASQAGVDGFRLDLATTLGRREDGFDPAAPLLAAMRQDPVLRHRRIIAEPWDFGPGGYRLGAFPPGWGEWNDRFRDGVRRFWRGDAGMVGELATRFAGSADLFGADRRASDSVNFVAAHDGFTLADLASFAHRHNQANGEHGRDGHGDNHSWNNGVEGATTDPGVLARRAADARALLAMLLTARGTPMLSMGDEAGRSQGGNNNAYAQDNATSWLDWPRLDTALAAFTARLIRARLAHPVLGADRPLTGAAVSGTALPDVAWRQPDGAPMAAADWAAPDRHGLVAVLKVPGDRVLVALHAGAAATTLVLPPPRPGLAWTVLADSADPARGGPAARDHLPLAARSVLLLAEVAARSPMEPGN